MRWLSKLFGNGSASSDRDGLVDAMQVRMEAMLEQERLFREDFTRGIARELRAYIDERLTEHRLFREEFSHLILEEGLRRVDSLIKTSAVNQRVLPYDADGKVLIYTTDGQRLLLDLAESFMSMHMIEHREWEPHVRNVMRKVLQPGSVFVDIGANIGIHTIFGASLVGDTGRVIAVEPHPRTNAFLRQNIEYNGLESRVSTFEKCADAVGGNRTTFEYFPQHPGMSGFRVSKERLAAFHGKVETIEVETTTIDCLLEPNIRPDLIKIDIEGFELQALKGARRTINENTDCCFLVEYEEKLINSVMSPNASNDIFVFFGNLGFSIFIFTPDAHPILVKYSDFPGEYKGDVLFIKPDSRHVKSIFL